MPYGFHVTGLAAHQVACALPVVKGKVLFQKFAVYPASHIVEKSLGSRLKDQLIQEAQNTGQ